MFNLFNKFPIVYYGDDVVINILAKVKFNDVVKKTGAIYYPYTILEGERPDIIAANYYDDPRYSWLIYMANDVVDPLHDWPLTEEEFSSFIIKKYGSIEKAKEKIHFWRNNWYEDDTMLTTSGYAALPSYAKKYFAPRIGNLGNVVAYERVKDDAAVETNKIIELTVANTAGFLAGEIVKQSTSGSVTGTATIKAIVDNVLIIQHVVGAISNTTGAVGNVVGNDSSKSIVVSDVNTITTSIPANEAVYWTYVTSFDYETELNEQKRHIKLIDKAYIDQIEKELDDLL